MSSRISSIGSIRRYSNIGYRISVLSDLVTTNRHLEICGEHIVVRLGSLINAMCSLFSAVAIRKLTAELSLEILSRFDAVKSLSNYNSIPNSD